MEVAHRHAEGNIASRLTAAARAFPDKPAVVLGAGSNRGKGVRQLRFRELDARCDHYAHGLARIGMERGQRVLLMVRPGFDFVALTFALFRAGAVPVFIDPGMGWRSFLRCVEKSGPTALIGVPQAHVLRLLRPRPFRSVRILITLGMRLGWGGWILRELRGDDAAAPFPTAPVTAADPAAVLFTTGSTGPAKGVLYTHGVFQAQIDMIQQRYGIGPDDVDLPCFPLFALFSVGLGATVVIPDIDPARPARVDPNRILQPLREQRVTCSFGSPALWDRVSRYAEARGAPFPSLTRVLMAGAPVPGSLHQRLLRQMPAAGAETHVPYGATEALPIASFTGSEMLAATDAATRAGAGMCVGWPFPEVTIRIIRVTDGIVETWDPNLVLAPGCIGEIVVRGPVVTSTYERLPEATRLAKIRDNGGVWHRMGDVGYLDDEGRLWYCGRKSQRVITGARTLYTVPCEAVFNQHPDVKRSALVGVGDREKYRIPVIVVEPVTGRFPRSRRQRHALARALLTFGNGSEITRDIGHVLMHRSFPVDIRHNAKIRREVLARWAARHVAGPD